MSSLLHNLMSLAMGLLVLAAPALCVCTAKPAAQETHRCCASKQAPTRDDGQDKSHSGACTHCGAQTARPTADQSPSLNLMLPVALLPFDLAPFLQPERMAACIASSQDPPGNPTPVVLHTCSLT